MSDPVFPLNTAWKVEHFIYRRHFRFSPTCNLIKVEDAFLTVESDLDAAKQFLERNNVAYPYRNSTLTAAAGTAATAANTNGLTTGTTNPINSILGLTTGTQPVDPACEYHDYVRKAGSQLWNELSRALEQTVNKRNFRGIMEEVLQENHLKNVKQPDYPGSVIPFSSPFYVERSVEESKSYNEILKPGAIVRVKGPMKMGKSSNG